MGITDTLLKANYTFLATFFTDLIKEGSIKMLSLDMVDKRRDPNTILHPVLESWGSSISRNMGPALGSSRRHLRYMFFVLFVCFLGSVKII